MHRSGTSLVASWLERCGLKVHDGKLVGSGPGNPAGHFEDRDFLGLHESVIKKAFPSSLGWKVTSGLPLWFSSESDVEGALQLVADRNGKYNQWGWKDPRTSLFLPQWKKLMPSLKTLILWRDCEFVVNSLVTRSHKSTNPLMRVGTIESIKLWLTYNRFLLENKKTFAQDSLLVSIESVISKDQRVLELINTQFSTHLVYSPISEVFDHVLLHRQRASYLLRLLCLYFGCYRLQRKLSSAADI